MIIHIAPWSNDPLKGIGLFFSLPFSPPYHLSSGLHAAVPPGGGIIVLQYRFTPIYLRKRENFS